MPRSKKVGIFFLIKDFSWECIHPDCLKLQSLDTFFLPPRVRGILYLELECSGCNSWRTTNQAASMLIAIWWGCMDIREPVCLFSVAGWLIHLSCLIQRRSRRSMKFVIPGGFFYWCQGLMTPLPWLVIRGCHHFQSTARETDKPFTTHKPI